MIRAGSVGISKICRDVVQWDEKGRTMISQIYVSFDSEAIRSVQFGYLENGCLVLSPKYGASESDGHNFKAVRLTEAEYVTGLSGVAVFFGEASGIYSGTAIRNLTFRTNRGTYGPIGLSSDKANLNGTKVEIDPAILDRNEFGGFFGSHDKHKLSSIGIYVNPIARCNTSMVKREKIDQAVIS